MVPESCHSYALHVSFYVHVHIALIQLDASIYYNKLMNNLFAMQNSIIIFLLSVLFYLVVYYWFIRKNQVFKSIYLNIGLLIIVSGFAGYQIAMYDHNHNWYILALVLILVLSTGNVIYRIRRITQSRM